MIRYAKDRKVQTIMRNTINQSKLTKTATDVIISRKSIKNYIN